MDSTSEQAAAALRQRDLVQWLENKFGTSDDDGNGWSAANLVQHVDGQLIEAIATACYSQLSTVCKQRLLLAIMHAPLTHLDKWCAPITLLVACTHDDPEEWMSVLGQLLHDYARTRVFNVDALLLNEYAQPLGDESDGGAATTTGGVEHLMHACADLKQTVGDTLSGVSATAPAPPLALFASRAALGAEHPHAAQLLPDTGGGIGSLASQLHNSHFSLKRRPKSAALKADLLGRAGDTHSLQAVKMRAKMERNAVLSDQRSSTDTANINYTDKVTLPAAGGASSALRQASGFTNDNKRALTMSGRPSLMLMKHRESAGGAKLIELDETPQALKKRRKIMEAEEKQKRKDEQEHVRERIEEEKEKRKQQIIDMKEAKRKAKETEIAERQQKARENMAGTAKGASAPVRPAAAVEQLRSPPMPAGGAPIAPVSHQQPQQAHTVPDYAAGLVPPPLAPATNMPSYAPPMAAMNVHYAPVGPTNTGGLMPGTVRLINYGWAYTYGTQWQLSPFSAHADRPANDVIVVDESGICASTCRLPAATRRAADGRTADADGADNPCAQMGDIITVRLSENQTMEQMPGTVVPVPVVVETFFQMNFSNGEWKKLRKVRALAST